MRIHIDIDTAEDFAESQKPAVRAFAAYLLTQIGDLDNMNEPGAPGEHAGRVPPGTSIVPPPPGNPPPPPPSNVTQLFPNGGNPPPPPPSATAGATPGAATAPTGAPAAPNAPATTTAAPLEFDTAGMPWDARIHQKGKNKKNDGTWKLRKLVNPTPQQKSEFETLVQTVTRELAAARASGNGVTAPTVNADIAARIAAAGGNVPPPPTVPLPPGSPGSGAVPLPPGSDGAATGNVPAPPVSAPVPPPPPGGSAPLGASAGSAPPAPSSVAGNPTAFRDLMAKITQATKDNKITPAEVMKFCQDCGAPNLTQLNTMAHLIPDVSALIDAKLMGG